MTIDLDDFGANHIISDQTQSHDCRDKLDALHYANPSFKVTLFAIPAEMTYEMLEWCKANSGWVELALHGFYHRSNYECSEMSELEFDNQIKPFEYMLETYFVKGFKAPGWQISDGIYKWLLEHGWWVSDQAYNDKRRPEIPAYVHKNGEFFVKDELVSAWHGHTWDCVGNGIYEKYDELELLVKNSKDFKFISEVLND